MVQPIGPLLLIHLRVVTIHPREIVLALARGVGEEVLAEDRLSPAVECGALVTRLRVRPQTERAHGPGEDSLPAIDWDLVWTRFLRYPSPPACSGRDKCELSPIPAGLSAQKRPSSSQFQQR